MPDELTLEIPVDPAYAVTARLFVATAARDLGLRDGSVDDLRLAVSELVANAVETGEPGPIALTIATEPGGLLVLATGVGPIGDEPPISRRTLLQALMDTDVSVTEGAVRLRMPLLGAEEPLA
jgi:anti-sigma regulatory factor (Ser/Thr protein kinase)